MPSADPVVCSLCGLHSAEASPLGWMLEVDRHRRRVWYCQRCLRSNVRAVESKLDSTWW